MCQHQYGRLMSITSPSPPISLLRNMDLVIYEPLLDVPIRHFIKHVPHRDQQHTDDRSLWAMLSNGPHLIDRVV